MTETDDHPYAARRAATGVPGLDTVLHGGFFPGSVHIVQGPPGAGKTVLANQVAFHYAARGERCLYITVMAESHDRLMLQLQGFSFFDAAKVPNWIYYESAYHTLDTEGAHALVRMVMEDQKQRGASLLVLDGLFAVAEHLESERAFRGFVNDLSALAHLAGMTVLLLTNSRRGSDAPEYTTADGWIELSIREKAYRTFRDLQVYKYRLSDFVAGRHMMTISRDGIRVLPRLETSEGQRQRSDRRTPGRLSLGIEALDQMLRGGVVEGSTTLFVGPTGAGKTSFGLHYLSQCTPEAPGLLFGFYENADDICEKGATLGIDIERLMRSGALEIFWQPPTENFLDSLGYAILAAVRARGVRRLFVDSVDGFAQSAVYPERLGRFLTALSNALHAEGVTSLFTLEVAELMGGEMRVQFTAISATAQNIVLLRYADPGGETRRKLSIIKTRHSGFDPAIREFAITEDGIRIADDAGGPSTGSGHRPSSGG